MVRAIKHETMGRSRLGWLDSYFHFSFAEYSNPANVQFGVLRVLNDDQIRPDTGFDTHPHRNMEIITYVIDGKLAHRDSMENQHILSRGQVQYMSAGTGVYHSEFNAGDETLRLFQIWILPDKNGYAPRYGDHLFTMEERHNRWMTIAAGEERTDIEAPIRVHADILMVASELDPEKELSFTVKPGRQAYLAVAEGEAIVNGISLTARDAMEIIEEDIVIKTEKGTHVLLMEMKKE